MPVKLKPYPQYKDSGVPWLGEIPAHWNVKPGFSVLSEQKVKNIGMTEKTVLSLSYGRIIVKPPEKLHGLVPESFETYQIADPGNIIIRSIDLQNDKTSLRVGLVKERGIITSAYLNLAVKGELTPDYGYLLLHSCDLLKVFYGMGSGLRQNLDFSDFKRMPVLVPSKEEQNKLSQYLDDANRKINRFIHNKRSLIKLLNEQKQAIINQAVTRGLDPTIPLKPSGISYLEDIPKHWDVWKLGYLAWIGNGSTPLRSNINYWQSGNYPWLNSSVVNREIISYSDQFVTSFALQECHLPKVKPGSVLVGITGQGKTRGMAALLGIEATISQHIAYISPKDERLLPQYLCWFLKALYTTLRTMSQDSGSTKEALTCQDIKNIRVALPSLDEQKAIDLDIKCSLERVNSIVTRTQHEIELMQEYRTRLISDVVTGKIDVRDIEILVLPDEDVVEELDEELLDAAEAELEAVEDADE